MLVVFTKKQVDIYALLSMKIVLILANSMDPDEMPQSVTLQLGHHCLKTYPFTQIPPHFLPTPHLKQALPWELLPS